jgi:hypothetical protein
MDLIMPPSIQTNISPLVVVSSSFNRFLKETALAMEELQNFGARVLSPKKPNPHSLLNNNFLLLEGDMLFPHSSIKSVQDRHNRCIRASHFLWLVCPGGYTGCSVAMEVGVAVASGVPIYSLHLPSDAEISKYVTQVASIKSAVEMHRFDRLK